MASTINSLEVNLLTETKHSLLNIIKQLCLAVYF